MDLKGSKTEANLQAAFAGESQARNKYDYFAKQASREGLQFISDIFTATALNEQAHAKIWYKTLTTGDPNGSIEPTDINLQHAIDGERFEHTEMYPGFAATAREEGFNDIAFLFDGVGAVEKEHDHRYSTIKKQYDDKKLFNRGEKVTWHCLNCGHLQIQEEAPTKCPVCSDPQGMFEVYCRDY
jgi:rubrerythrin